MKTIKLLTALAIASVVLIVGCKKDDFVEVVGLCPLVISTSPENGANNVQLNKVVTATFNEKMNASTFSSTSYTLAQGTTAVAGAVTYKDSTASFTPSSALLPFVVYTGTVKQTVKDVRGNALQTDYVWTFTTIPQLTLQSLPVADGTTSGAGLFAQGSTVAISATPNTGFTFVNWTDNGIAVSTSSSYQFTMAGNKTLVANFIPVVAGNFAVNLTANPTAGGTTNGAGSFTAGSSVTVSTFPNSGYIFKNWTENGTIVSTSSSYQFTLTANRTLVANFTVIPASQFAVNLSSNPSAGGSTNGSGSFNSASSVTVSATANTGYSFVNWTENGAMVSTSASYTFVLNANKTLVANFAINTYTLNVTAVGGTVVKSPLQANYNYGTNVNLTATASAGYTFASWSGDASGSANPTTVSMTANKNVTANFTANAYTLTVSATNGSVSKAPSKATYAYNDVVVLTATPNLGYAFTSWSGDAFGAVTPYSLTMNGNKSVTAIFTLIPPLGPGVIDLGTAADYTALSKSGISTTGVTSITGNIGVSPASASALTGFGLIMNTDGQSSHTPIVTGNVYAADYAVPTPAKLTTAISDMETALTTANGLTTNVIVDLYAGDISGRTLAPGLYKWSTGVLITNAGVTLNGGPNDTWVFQIAQDLTVSNSAIVTLSGGAQAKNIFWVTAKQATLGSNVDFSGNIISKTLISLNTGAKVTGRLLAQTAVTLNAATVVQP